MLITLPEHPQDRQSSWLFSPYLHGTNVGRACSAEGHHTDAGLRSQTCQPTLCLRPAVPGSGHGGGTTALFAYRTDARARVCHSVLNPRNDTAYVLFL